MRGGGVTPFVGTGASFRGGGGVPSISWHGCQFLTGVIFWNIWLIFVTWRPILFTALEPEVSYSSPFMYSCYLIRHRQQLHLFICKTFSKHKNIVLKKVTHWISFGAISIMKLISPMHVYKSVYPKTFTYSLSSPEAEVRISKLQMIRKLTVEFNLRYVALVVLFSKLNR